MKYKFKVGDRLEIVSRGNGYGNDCLGEIVTVLELGVYTAKTPAQPGYRTTKTKGGSNANSGRYDGMAGEASFKLAEPTTYEIY